MAHAELLEAGQGRVTNIPGHAGGFETAAMRAVFDELVAAPPERADYAAPRTSFLPDFRTEVHGS